MRNDAFPKKILIVEDSKLNAQITADILSKYEYKTDRKYPVQFLTKNVKLFKYFQLFLEPYPCLLCLSFCLPPGNTFEHEEKG